MMRQKFHVKITKPGTMYIGLTLLVGIAAVNTGNSVLYLIVSIMLALMTLSGISSFVNLSFLEVKLSSLGEIYAYQRSLIKAEIKNKKVIPSFFVELKHGKVEKSSIIDYLPPKSSINTTLWVTFFKRGWQKVGDVEVFSFFPMGFICRTFTISINDQVLVYPKPVKCDLNNSLKELGLINIRHSFEEYEDFKGFKEYMPGDPIKLIHWLTSAKKGKLISKEFHNSKAFEFWLVIPDSPKEDIEVLLGKLTYLCNILFEKNFSVGLKTPFKIIKPNRDSKTRREILLNLALYDH